MVQIKVEAALKAEHKHSHERTGEQPRTELATTGLGPRRPKTANVECTFGRRGPNPVVANSVRGCSPLRSCECLCSAFSATSAFICTIVNGAYCIECGKDTKLECNKGILPTKSTRVDEAVDGISRRVFIMQFVFIVLLGTIGNIWQSSIAPLSPYLGYDPHARPGEEHSAFPSVRFRVESCE
ncbi:hypothetical protein CYMTET_15950 [Cymbomonas tetramitiformis]|uniref:Uncharacterized protein n=1 Tax=Cymbomonas tetramitiformis TaxID=36881 RepID=A0AAE0GDE9_9CHLO|nr:hypothetical protein CYMTET_15950 [Cymbomonas tetramitiformis]